MWWCGDPGQQWTVTPTAASAGHLVKFLSRLIHREQGHLFGLLFVLTGFVNKCFGRKGPHSYSLVKPFIVGCPVASEKGENNFPDNCGHSKAARKKQAPMSQSPYTAEIWGKPVVSPLSNGVGYFSQPRQWWLGLISWSLRTNIRENAIQLWMHLCPSSQSTGQDLRAIGIAARAVHADCQGLGPFSFQQKKHQRKPITVTQAWWSAGHLPPSCHTQDIASAVRSSPGCTLIAVLLWFSEGFFDTL